MKLDVPALRDLFRRLADSGVHNLNLVTASHFSDTVAEALAGLRLEIPVVWNSSGYETVEQLRQLDAYLETRQ